MLHIQRRHIVAKMQRCGTNNQVLERDRNSLSSLFTINLTSQPRDIERHWIYEQVMKSVFCKGLPPFPVSFISRSVNSMR